VSQQLLPAGQANQGIEAVKCRNTLVRAALADMNAPVLNAVHARRSVVLIASR
jgi:hypothetical protein